MNIRQFLLAGIISISGLSFAQTSEVLFTIDNKPFYTDEFVRVYNKNLDLVKDESQKDLNNYLDLYLAYKLKVNKAYQLDLDKDSRYINELKSYRTQLAKEYLTDKKVTNELMHEAYERSLKEVKASHILFLVDQDASPQDTLKVYQKAVSVRNRILKGEDFKALAEQFSEDPSAKENKGDIGYFSAFRMVYPFETGAYNTKVGEVSKPIRSRFGYHLINVTDIRDNRGDVVVGHIMLSKSEDKAKNQENANKIKDIYQKLQQGEKFEDLAKQFSEDKTTSDQGGKLARISSGQLNSVVFEDAVFSLMNIEDYSKPVETEFGWHIIKLFEKFPVKTFEEAKADIENSIKRDERSRLIEASMNHKLEAKYKPVADSKLMAKILTLVDNGYYTGEFSLPENTAIYDKTVLTLGAKKISGVEFLNYIKKQQNRMQRVEPLEKLKKDLAENFMTSSLNAHYEENLEKEFPEFNYIMQEYKEGLLLFDLMEKEIWQKAQTDTLGLEAFYQKNKDHYKWNQRIDAIVASSVKPEFVEKAQKFFKKKKSVDYIKKQLNKDAVVNIMIDQGYFEQGSNGLPKEYKLSKGVSDIFKEGNYYYVILGQKILPSTTKTLEEARGRVVSDYQQYLEEHWLDALKKEFSYKVDHSVFEKVKKELKK
ncbi:MAG TPA: peptidylprolyl isomerase [Flavobacterium sp.]|nr:peptidylprolyl isomerase [Flavobacterium sp.]